MSSFLPTLRGFAQGSFTAAAGVATVATGLLYYGQEWLIYPSGFPEGSRTDVPNPSEFGLPYEPLTLTTPDNVVLHSYLLRQKREMDSVPKFAEINTEGYATEEEFVASRPTVVMFHGNGGNLGHRIPLAKVFFAKMRCNVVMVCYRGYGLSEGAPSEKGLRIDSQAALDFILGDPALSKTDIVIYGQSIGGAVSIALAAANPKTISAVILENTFMSLPTLIPHALPVLGPFAFLCHQKWDSAGTMPSIPPTTPILMLSGMQDEIVPKEHMRALWEVAKLRGTGKKPPSDFKAVQQQVKEGVKEEVIDPRYETLTTGGDEVAGRSTFLEFAHGSHNDTCMQPRYWAAIADFVAALGDGQGSKL